MPAYFYLNKFKTCDLFRDLGSDGDDNMRFMSGDFIYLSGSRWHPTLEFQTITEFFWLSE